MTVGLPVHVMEVGPERKAAMGADSESFVLLHGYAGSSFTWHAWVPALAVRGRVILVDMKGFGEAPKPDDGRYSPVDLAEVIADLIQSLDLRRVTLIGHSLGGGVALLSTLMLMARGELRIGRLAIIAGAAYRQRLPPFVTLAHWPRLSTLLMRLVGPRRVVREVLRSIVYDRDAVSADQIEAYSRPLGSPDGVRALLDAGRQIMPDSIDDLTVRFREIEIPVLLMWGKQDRVVPLWVGRRLESELPNARLEILEKCGHIPPEELPELSLAIVETFLDANPVS